MSDAMVKYPGFDRAILGMGVRCGQREVLVYDYERMVGIVMNRDGVTSEDADDFLSYNTNQWVGDGTPVILYPLEPDEINALLEDNELCLD